MIRLSKCGCCTTGSERTGGPGAISDASEKRWRAYAEGRTPRARTSSSHERSLALAARRDASQVSGWNQYSARTAPATSRHGASRRRTCTSSCDTTASRRPDVQLLADAGSRITGLSEPPVMGVETWALDRIRASPRTRVRCRSISIDRIQSGSPIGVAPRTSLRKRRAATPREASPTPQPSAQMRNTLAARVIGTEPSAREGNGRYLVGTGATEFGWRPEVGRLALAVADGSLAVSSGKWYSIAVVRAGRMGRSHEGASRLSNGNTSSTAKVVVHNRCRVFAGPRLTSQARTRATDRTTVAFPTRPMAPAAVIDRPVIVHPPRLHRSSS